MSESPFTQSHAPKIDRSSITLANPTIMSGARWFWWIAGLSAVNTVLLHSGSNTSFVIGLGMTLVADVLLQNMKAIALVFDVIVLAYFVGVGYFAAKGYRWAFIAGILVYLLDLGIYVYFQDWMPVAFHALALFYIIRGFNDLRIAIKDAASAPAAPAPTQQTPAA